MTNKVYTLVAGIVGGVQTAVDAVLVYLGAVSVISATQVTIAVACIGVGVTAVLTICSKLITDSSSSS
jgi:hypothetical protein